jgi:hypothetical protein
VKANLTGKTSLLRASIACGSIVLFMTMSACSEVSNKKKNQIQQRLSAEHLLDKHFKAPKFSIVAEKQDLPGTAIWGATGKDNNNRLYFGLSNPTDGDATAHLLMYDPATNTTKLQSDALSQLKRANLYTENMRQSTLHSKIISAPDGLLYFTSFDYSGQTERRNPTWGSHMWRKFPESDNWEHVFETDEALIALNAHGRFVYALGHWGHVLYQYDTQSQRESKITIGSIPGHRSTNFVINNAGHIFVPRIEQSKDGKITSVLVELNDQLSITDVHALPDYWNTNSDTNHGIVGYVKMKNGDIYFTVSTGGLYHVTQSQTGRHEVNYLGKFDIEFSRSYIASLFSPNGESMIVGLGRDTKTKAYYWHIRELTTGLSANYPLPELSANQLLYGSVTTDNAGNMYIVGQNSEDPESPKPIIYKVSFAEE